MPATTARPEVGWLRRIGRRGDRGTSFGSVLNTLSNSARRTPAGSILNTSSNSVQRTPTGSAPSTSTASIQRSKPPRPTAFEAQNLVGRDPLGQVLTAVRAGVPTNKLAATLGIDPGLTDMALQHWVNRGVITTAGELALVCNGCAPNTVANNSQQPKSPKCVGCPFAR